MTAATVQGAVERFLDDAETAAHQGNAGRAHQLMLLALDTRPGDSQVLMRVSLVRDTLAAILGEENTAEAEQRRRARPKAGRRRSERDRSRNNEEYDDIFHPIPGFDGNPNENTPSGAQVPSDVVIRGLPSDAGLASGAPGVGPTIGLTNDEDDESEWIAVQPIARVVATAPVAPIVVEKKRRPRLMLYGLWLVLALAVVSVLVVVLNPGFVNGLVNRVTNPLAAAQDAIAKHNYPEAAKRAREALTHGADPVQGNIILGQALLAQHDAPGGRAALVKAEAVDSAGTWQTSMQLGSLLLEAGDTATASKAYYSAYLKSAPIGQFMTIIKGQLLAGDLKLPSALLSELASRRDPGYLADSVQIMGLYHRVQSTGHP